MVLVEKIKREQIIENYGLQFLKWFKMTLNYYLII